MSRGLRSDVRRVLVGLVAAVIATTAAALPAEAKPGPAPAPTASGRVGSWEVRSLSSDLWEVSWRSPQVLPTTSDRPVIVRDASPIGTSVVKDHRVVSTVVRSAQAPDPSKLDVVLSGDRLSSRGRDVHASRIDSVDSSPGRLLPFDPADAGPYPVVQSDYSGDSVPMTGMAEPVEFVGHVVEPAPSASTGPRGIVLFLHGRHMDCYIGEEDSGDHWPCVAPAKDVPSQLGYDYIQQRLASQGYFTVSIRANGINAQDDSLVDAGADARAKLVQRHLQYWAARAAEHQLDLSNVVLVGHSRGGEGVARAALQIPLSAPYRIVGVVLLAPTNFADQAVPYIPTLSVLPSCDGDVTDLEGQTYVDAARDVVADDTSLHASVLVTGADHNYFNTEWTPGSAGPSVDDWQGDETAVCGEKHPQRLSAAEQRSVGLAYVAGAVHLFTGSDPRTIEMLDGERVRVASTGRAVVLSEAVGGGRDLRAPGQGTGTTDGTMNADFCRGISKQTGGHSICGRRPSALPVSPHWLTTGAPDRPALELAWDAVGQAGGLLFDRPLDLRSKTLQLRTIIDPANRSVTLGVRLTDTDGKVAELEPVGGQEQRAFDGGSDFAQMWAQTLIVDPASAAIDLANVTSVELVSRSATGRVWILDLAAVSAKLPAVVNKRIPLVSLGVVKEPEGNDPNVRTAKVPFTVSGKVPTRGSFVVRVASYDTTQKSDRITVQLAPGQTNGSIPVDVVGDTASNLGELSGFNLTGWAVRGVMTDAYVGRLDLQDDDPMPKITLTAKRKTVKEGQTATWVFRLSHPLGKNVQVLMKVVRGPRKVRALNGPDVAKSWRRKYASSSTQSLYAQGVAVTKSLKAGSTTVRISIPIAKDHRAEKREQLTMQFSFVDIGKISRTRTVYVAASRR